MDRLFDALNATKELTHLRNRSVTVPSDRLICVTQNQRAKQCDHINGSRAFVRLAVYNDEQVGNRVTTAAPN